MVNPLLQLEGTCFLDALPFAAKSTLVMVTHDAFGKARQTAIPGSHPDWSNSQRGKSNHISPRP